MSEVLERIKKRGVVVELDDAAMDFLITKGFSEDYGARPLRRAIERYVEDPLAEEILRIGEDVKTAFRGFVDGDPKEVDSLTFERVEETEPEEEPVKAAAATSEDT